VIGPDAAPKDVDGLLGVRLLLGRERPEARQLVALDRDGVLLHMEPIVGPQGLAPVRQAVLVEDLERTSVTRRLQFRRERARGGRWRQCRCGSDWGGCAASAASATNSRSDRTGAATAAGGGRGSRLRRRRARAGRGRARHRGAERRRWSERPTRCGVDVIVRRTLPSNRVELWDPFFPEPPPPLLPFLWSDPVEGASGVTPTAPWLCGCAL
jgi:hypothetical protein